MNNKYNRLALVNVDTKEVIANAHIKADNSEEVILNIQNKNQIEGLRKSNNKIKDIKEFIQANEGNYIHLIYKYCYPLFDKLQEQTLGTKSNIHIVRFIILSTYLNFNNNLYDNNNNRIKKSSLSKIWDTKNNRKSINETYNLLKEVGYIYEDTEGYIMINQDLIIKGTINNFKKLHKQDKNLTYTRLFTKNIQDMYFGTDPKARKQLANLFKILPFINFKHNVFCSNPTETNFDNLDLLNWTDLARICGYESNSNISKFKKDLWNLEIFGKCTIGQFSCRKGYYIAINPKIYYGGNDIDDVQFLYKSFGLFENKQ